MSRHIIHTNAVDFPVQVERIQNPKLRTWPVVVAPPDDRAVVYAASQEARQAGVYPGMLVKSARKRCRDVVVRPPNTPLYYRASVEMNRILGHFSPLVEPEQRGRVFLDVSGTERLFGSPVDTGNRARKEILQRLKMEVNVGVASNKLVSKIAAHATGQEVNSVALGQEARFIAPFHVNLLPTVTRKIQTQLLDLNIRLIKEVAEINTAHLTMVFGRMGRQLSEYSHGIDPRPVLPPARATGIVEIKIFDNDTNDVELLLGELFTLAENAARRLQRNRVQAYKIRVFLRHSDYTEKQALARLRAPCVNTIELFDVLRPLFFRTLKRRVRVRQLAVNCLDLRPVTGQLSLFDDTAPSKTLQVMNTMEKIRDRFGENSIRFARTIEKAR